MNNDYIYGSLCVFDDFRAKDTGFHFTYNCHAREFDLLKEKYNIDEVAGGGSELDKVINLLAWCSKNVQHNGGLKDVEFVPKTSLGILDYSFGKGREYGVYCRLQAIVFTECCLALGIKSRILHCLPYSPYDFDSHVVSMVFLTDFNKWAMFDAGNNRYFIDDNGIPLSPFEVRNCLGNRTNLKCNVEDIHYMDYMAKNLFYFKSLQINTFGSDLLPNQTTVYCIPKGFDVMKREIKYCQYAIENSPAESIDDWKQALEEFQSRDCICILNKDEFLQTP